MPWDPGVRRGGKPVLFAMGCRRGSVLAPWAMGGPVLALPFPWATGGRRGVVAGPLGPRWPPWGHGESPGPRQADVEAWSFPRNPGGRRGGVGGLLGPCGRSGGVAGPLHPIRLPWRCGRSPKLQVAAAACRWCSGLRVAALGVWPVSCTHLAAVGMWLAPWVPSGRYGSASGLLCPIWATWRRGW